MNQRVNTWDKAPFVRLLPPLIAGIIVAGNFPNTIQPYWIGLGVSFLACFFFALKKGFPGYSWRWIPGITINALLFFTGSLLFRQNQITNKPGWLGNHLPKAKYLIGTPQSIATPAKQFNRITFTVSASIDSGGQPVKVTGTIILYVPLNYGPQFLPGDYWIIPAGVLQKIRSPNNPGSFDYAKYCARQNIYHQGFCRDGQFKMIAASKSFQLTRLLAKGQLSALKAMRENVPENARGLAMALLIGYRNEVEKPLLQAYTNTGVVHVIAVSGMHLGLIFLLLQKALVFPDKRFKFFKWLKAILVLLIIWWFSGVAGAAPSIIRAAFMFSIVLLAKLLRKPMDNIQSICLGAFALLCYNPLWLWDAGFQLSFAALLSIICYQPLISNWVQVNNPILKTIWDLTAVTLAAQVLTLPISIGQFHQAPVYFLAANLLAVPVSSMALITAILQWIIAAIGFQFTFPGMLTGLQIQLMNMVIQHINSIPGATIDQIEWSANQTILAYAIIIALTCWLIYRSSSACILCLLALGSFAAIRFANLQTHSNQEVLLAFQVPHKRQLVLLQGEKMFLLSPTDPAKSQELLAAKRYFHIKKIIPLSVSLYRYRNLSIAIPGGTSDILPLLEKKPAYIFLPDNLENIAPYLPAISNETTVVMDGNIPEWRSRQWCRLLKEKQVSHYSTWESGALHIPINKF